MSGRRGWTVWRIEPSLTFDALCLMNTLSGDPYYLVYYRSEFDRFDPLLTAEEREAFRAVKRTIKDEGRGIVSAHVALILSCGRARTLDRLVRQVEDRRATRAAFARSDFWDADAWKGYDRARPALATALRALKRVGFEGYWRQHVLPHVEERVRSLTSQLGEYDFLPVVSRLLGRPARARRLTVHLLQFSQPHGIRVSGLRFLTHVDYPVATVLRNALHESLHPPFDRRDPRVRAALRRLGRDPAIREIVRDHDRSLGYNTVAGYVEEDCVQALEEIVAEKFGVGRDSRWYWKTHDGGMHRFAAAVYAGFHELAGADPPGVRFPEWFVRAVEAGRLEGRTLRLAAERFFG
jgi:hypothetical protein